MKENSLERELHDKVVAEIAKARFTRPGQEFVPGVQHPTWKTYTNVPNRDMPVKGKGGVVLYPDIVIVDAEQNNAPVAICEVETASSITEEAAQRWADCVDACHRTHLYVPEGYAIQAARIVAKLKVPILVLRTYGFDDLWNIRITAV